MTRRAAYRLVLMLLGIAVCLTIPACRTSEQKVSDSDELSTSSDAACEVTQRLKRITIPEMTFYPPATIADAIDFLKQASIDYDDPSVPLDQRGVGYILRLNQDPSSVAVETTDAADVFASAATASRDLPRIAAMSVRFISLYDAYNLVCEATDMEWNIIGGKIGIVPKERAETRFYNVPQALKNELYKENPLRDVNDNSDKVWEILFKQLGVLGPAWAKVEYLPAIGKLRVTNSPRNLEIIERVIDQFAEFRVEMALQIHAFRTSDIERLRLFGGVTVESLMTLREKGMSKSVATINAQTMSGQEIILKAVKELSYPSDWVADVLRGDSNQPLQTVNQTVRPADFVTRELGMILQALPEVMRNRELINLTLKPQYVALEGWEPYSTYMSADGMHAPPSPRQPIIGVTSFETQVLVKDGATVLLGSSSTHDGEWVQVGFLTARLQDIHPRLSANQAADKIKPRDERKDAEVEKKMRSIVIPEMTFRPPATLIDGFRFLRDASIQHDKASVSEDQRGINMILKLPTNSWGVIEVDKNGEQTYSQNSTTNAPPIPRLSARFLNLYDALKLVCELTGMKLKIRDGIVWIVPIGDPCEGMFTRLYLGLEPLRERMNSVDHYPAPDLVSSEADLIDESRKVFFQQLGVNWPTGSSLEWVDPVSAIRLTNTFFNMALFEGIIEDIDTGYPRMVEVDVQIHAFPAETFEHLSRSGIVAVEDLMALRRKGMSRPVASATMLTKSGQEAIVKSIREVIYPSSLLTCLDQADTNVTAQGETRMLLPGNFVTRETGMILQVAPVISDSVQDEIHVVLKPRRVTFDGWETYSADQATGRSQTVIPFKQPIFGVISFETQIKVKDGLTVLLGTASSSDNKWINVGFLTVRRKTMSGDTAKDAKQ